MTALFRFIAILFLAFAPLPALALSSDWVTDEAADVRLISAVDATGDAASIPLGLEIKLKPGWHTYWRSPGIAGLPPQLDWSRSQDDAHNVDTAAFFYPAPKRYTSYGLETVGYEDSVLFPISLQPRVKGKAVDADVSVDYLVCSSICVPKHADLRLTLPEGTATPGAEAPLLQQALDKIPEEGSDTGILLRGLSTDGQRLTLSVTSRAPLTQPDIFIENDKEIGFGAPEVALDPSGRGATLTVSTVDTLPSGTSLANLPIVVTFVDGNRAAEIRTTTPATLADALTTTAPDKLPLTTALIFALLGGLILNLMPCVLPVLSLKILSLVSHGGDNKRAIRLSFVTTAAGILFSFLLLAGLAVALKNLQLTLGWGVQFQQPGFLMFLVALLVLFAANMWGLFEIELPRFLADRIGENDYKSKLAGDFATGAFATLLATPCSAPFLGTAVGFALAAGPIEITAVFLTLGFGMSLPYFLVALAPGLAAALPKPGAWMVKLRALLGIALALTALWLIWVMTAQISEKYATLFGLAMAAVVLLLAIKKHGLKSRLIWVAVAAVFLLSAGFIAKGMALPKAPPEMDKRWIPYSESALRADLAEGKTVFLDVTADWCLTCKANMKLTLGKPEIEDRLFRTDIIAMQANWTNPDPAIAELLHRYGRYGIPFNMVFGPGAPEGIMLPELLTPTLVFEALDKASGKKKE